MVYANDVLNNNFQHLFDTTTVGSKGIYVTLNGKNQQLNLQSAAKETRTLTPLRAPPPQDGVATNYTTAAIKKPPSVN